MTSRVLGFCIGLGCFSAPTSTAWALETQDHFTLLARSETQLQLFRRALLPGPNGALPSTETAAPLYQYLQLSARDVDTAWKRDSLDLELSVWGRAALSELEHQSGADGDIQSANVGLRGGPFSVRLGRQQEVGGAARYARFDGAEVGVVLGRGFALVAYGGFSVMPHWSERPGYRYLGAAADSQLRELALGPAGARDSRWLVGSRLLWSDQRHRLSLSAHEQRENGGIAHRNLGADGRVVLSPEISLGGNAVLDLDTTRFADARLFADYDPLSSLSVSAEYLHSTPSLLLSRQSVLSVFGADSYEEGGGSVRLRPLADVTLQASGFIERYESTDSGARGELAVSAWLDARRRTYARSGYARVVVAENGYSSLRLSLARRFTRALESTAEAYLYWYDRAVHGYRSSSVYAGTLSLRPLTALSVLLGASLARVPYAALDAQAQLRVVVDLDLSRPGARQ